jgi:hypothetical protein
MQIRTANWAVFAVNFNRCTVMDSGLISLPNSAYKKQQEKPPEVNS